MSRCALWLIHIHQSEITVALLDMTMPQMGGADVLAALRETDTTLPVVLTSGYPEEDALRNTTSRGNTYFVHKPFTIHSLLSKIHEAIES